MKKLLVWLVVVIIIGIIIYTLFNKGNVPPPIPVIISPVQTVPFYPCTDKKCA